jgi:hypothetical protein
VLNGEVVAFVKEALTAAGGPKGLDHVPVVHTNQPARRLNLVLTLSHPHTPTDNDHVHPGAPGGQPAS